MNLNSKKPEKRPLYVYYIIAVVIIVLLNVFALPALSERSVKRDRLHHLPESCRQRKSI